METRAPIVLSLGTAVNATQHPRLHSYVIEHDFGFAPNPFHGICTLATCKPRIRSHAALGDFIIGTGCAKRGRTGHLVYFMRVDEASTFDRYWRDQRFREKRPAFNGSKKYCFGDNIYHRHSRTGEWVQANSLHRLPAQPNLQNLQQDTGTTDRVLIAREFAYWGGFGPPIPQKFRKWRDGEKDWDVCQHGQGHKNRFPSELVVEVIAWLRSLNQLGYIAKPLEWTTPWRNAR